MQLKAARIKKFCILYLHLYLYDIWVHKGQEESESEKENFRNVYFSLNHQTERISKQHVNMKSAVGQQNIH